MLPQPHASTKLFMFCATGWLLEQTVGEGQVSPTYLHLYICRYVVGRREGGRYPKHGRNPRCRSCWFTTTEKISNAADVSAQSAREGGTAGDTPGNPISRCIFTLTNLAPERCLNLLQPPLNLFRFRRTCWRRVD